ncbi:MAG TPA: hypothetical protein VLH16_00895 [Bacteroidales bacterium]|nr:hypothetical protein [Bacteroidales bacterium]
MASKKAMFQQIRHRVTVIMAENTEMKNKLQQLLADKSKLESRIEKVTAELKVLTQESTDLKEIVYDLNRENARFRKQGDKRPEATPAPEISLPQPTPKPVVTSSEPDIRDFQPAKLDFASDENNVDAEER